MKQEEFVRLIQGALLLFDGLPDADLLLRKGFTYKEIRKAKKIRKFVEELKDES